ncbi:ferredoxin reductase family protein [Gryllotalpicola protaetiae]|uniref:Oxidoreductase n=1 Tax=Gryllotalpicola protaetiae TaxID=2419771 RepID=A0A387BW70_9MICO|nr:ferredoxin reductase family protein [Gryllotalpicola protaetiae]AYG02631.1 oxidoreductase [Gryllotalpicola protaetiae]
MRRGVVALLAVAGGAAVVGLWWPTAVVTGSGSALTTAVAELAGMIGSYLVCIQLLLIARVPWLERLIGLDRLIGWHKVVGTATLFLVLAHVGFMTLSQWIASGHGPIGAYLGLFSLYPDMLTATIGTAVVLLAGLLSAQALRRLLPYEVWYWTHVTTYVAIFLTFLHQISAGPVFVGHPFARGIWIAMYITTAACIFYWRVATPLMRFAEHRFEVVSVVPESARLTSVWIRSRRPELLAVRPGQFMLFRFLERGHLLSAHPYSISNVPADGLVRITVADLGDHSGRLRDLRPGTKVLLEGPFGGFVGRRRTGSVLLVAGGAGIGPIRGLAEQFARMGRSVVVIYRASRADELAFHAEFAGLPSIRVIPLIGRRDELGFDPLDAESLGYYVPDAAQREAFVCGPPAMIDKTADSLRALRVRRVQFEELSFA